MTTDLQTHELVRAAGAGRVLAIPALGATITYRVASEETGGAWSLLEYVAPPHFPGPALHWHEYTAELFYVLEGTLGFRIGDETITAAPGTSVHVPPGAIHTFFNPASAPVRFLTWTTPGDFDRYFRDLAALIEAEGAWPPRDPAALEAIWAKYDLHNVPAGQSA